MLEKMVLVDQGTTNSGGRRTRAWLARAILLVASASLLTGILLNRYQSRAEDPWRARIVRGEPVEVRFLCGAGVSVDCKTPVRIAYQKQDSRWCSGLQPGDQREVPEKRWCNADPEHGTISIFGIVHSFDRFGILRIDDHLVGQMLPG